MAGDASSPTFSVTAPKAVPKPEEPEERDGPETAEASKETESSAAESPSKAHSEDEKFINGQQPPKDPLRWFGILVPHALRSAQSSFVSGVEGHVPKLATLTKDLRRREVDIGRLRKQIRKL